MNIISAADHYCMFVPGDVVVVAVSGGPDSVAMLHSLHTCSKEMQITLHVAHLNHGIRGDESNIDQDFVSKLAHQFGISFTTKRVDVPRLRSRLKMGEEEAARLVRYKFLQDTCTQLGATKIAVGHNADDRAESVLLNLIRGSGIDGLGSIRPIRGNIVRPLIDTTRSQILEYINEHKLPFRVDESNMDINYTRNRVRHELIPILERDYNPKIREALARLADIASADSDYLNQMAQASTQAVKMRGSIDALLLIDQPLALQRRIIRAEIEKCKGNLLDVSLQQIDRVIQALCSGDDFTITLPSGIIYAQRRGSEFKIINQEQEELVDAFEYTLNVPGETNIPETNSVIIATLDSDVVGMKLPANEIILDPKAITGNLRARSIRPGDRINPFGMKGEKKLQDVFIDKKIPRRKRAKAIVIEDTEKILWVVGVVASEATRISGRISEAIHLRESR